MTHTSKAFVLITGLGISDYNQLKILIVIFSFLKCLSQCQKPEIYIKSFKIFLINQSCNKTGFEHSLLILERELFQLGNLHRKLEPSFYFYFEWIPKQSNSNISKTPVQSHFGSLSGIIGHKRIFLKTSNLPEVYY